MIPPPPSRPAMDTIVKDSLKEFYGKNRSVDEVIIIFIIAIGIIVLLT
jgi:hypothetical protein